MTYTALRIRGKVAAILRENANGTITTIPLDPNNIDYQDFLEWLKTNTLDLSDQPWSPPQEEIDHAADIADIKTQYQAAVDRLVQIRDAVSPTNAQVVQAVRDMATIQLRVLKLLRWLV